MRQLKQCVICKKEFYTNSSRKKTCSHECSLQHTRNCVVVFRKKRQAKLKQQKKCIKCKKPVEPVIYFPVHCLVCRKKAQEYRERRKKNGT